MLILKCFFISSTVCLFQLVMVLRILLLLLLLKFNVILNKYKIIISMNFTIGTYTV